MAGYNDQDFNRWVIWTRDVMWLDGLFLYFLQHTSFPLNIENLKVGEQ